MRFSRLVLPEPFGPIRAVISPGFADSETSLTAVTPPKRTVRSRTDSSLPPRLARVAASVPRSTLISSIAGSESATVADRPPASQANLAGRILRNAGWMKVVTDSRPAMTSRPPEARSEYCDRDALQIGRPIRTAVATNGPRTDRVPPTTEAAMTPRVVVRPNDGGDTYRSRKTNSTPATPAGTPASA